MENKVKSKSYELVIVKLNDREFLWDLGPLVRVVNYEGLIVLIEQLDDCERSIQDIISELAGYRNGATMRLKVQSEHT